MEVLTSDYRYATATSVKDVPTYLVEISKVLSTDPDRDRDVLDIETEHHGLFK